MLKALQVRSEEAGFLEEVLQEGIDKIPAWKDDMVGEAIFGEQLSTDQTLQVKGVMDEFQEIFSNRLEELTSNDSRILWWEAAKPLQRRT